MEHFVVVQYFEDSHKVKIRAVVTDRELAEAVKRDLIDNENDMLVENYCEANAADFFTVQTIETED